MFVLKEKLINSILIKVKGEGCVLYSCWIPLPLRKQKEESPVCKGLPIPHTSLSPSFGAMGWQCLGAGAPSALPACPDLWSLGLELYSGCSNKPLTDRFCAL